MINKALSKRILGAVLYDAGTWYMSGLDRAHHESKADSGNALHCHLTTNDRFVKRAPVNAAATQKTLVRATEKRGSAENAGTVQKWGPTGP